MVKNKLRSKAIKIAGAVVLITIAIGIIWLNQEPVIAFIEFVRDREAVVAYLDQKGYAGPLVLMGLIALQVLIPSLPSEPPMIAGSYIYGFTSGVLMSWIVSAAASQAVFYLARFAGSPIAEKMVPPTVLDKWTRKAGEKGMIFFMLAFIIPPIPSDIMTYVAGLSAISGRRFLVANLIGRLPMVVLLSLVGANGLTITSNMLIGITVVGLLMLAAWWYFIMREQKPSARITSSQTEPQLSLNPGIPYRLVGQTTTSIESWGAIK